MHRQSIVGVLFFLLLSLPTGERVAAASSECAISAVATALEPEFNDLRAALGDIMGQPDGCAGDPTGGPGDRVQRTTTGLAMYRAASGTAEFVSGNRRWALVDGVLSAWTANWHEGFNGPEGTFRQPSAPGPSGPAQSIAPLATVHAVTFVGPRDGHPQQAMLVSDGVTYAIQLPVNCHILAETSEHPSFVTARGPLPSAGDVLVFLADHQSCPILAAQRMP
jgi:hypothetical protein